MFSTAVSIFIFTINLYRDYCRCHHRHRHHHHQQQCRYVQQPAIQHQARLVGKRVRAHPRTAAQRTGDKLEYAMRLAESGGGSEFLWPIGSRLTSYGQWLEFERVVLWPLFWILGSAFMTYFSLWRYCCYCCCCCYCRGKTDKQAGEKPHNE